MARDRQFNLLARRVDVALVILATAAAALLALRTLTAKIDP
jgi:hypothetical protein